MRIGHPVADEVGFVCRTQHEELAAELAAAKVTVVHRPDVWSNLLEPGAVPGHRLRGKSVEL